MKLPSLPGTVQLFPLMTTPCCNYAVFPNLQMEKSRHRGHESFLTATELVNSRLALKPKSPLQILHSYYINFMISLKKRRQPQKSWPVQCSEDDHTFFPGSGRLPTTFTSLAVM